ncbi:MAG: DUF429 domain-containing protein [Candidatus Oleimicrobiaceae bacterium]
MPKQSQNSPSDLLFGGLDPSGSAARPTALAILDDELCVRAVGSRLADEEISSYFAPHREQLFAIGLDGPCALPVGLEECCFRTGGPPCAHQQPDGKKGRACEQELARRGIGCFFTVKGAFAKSWILRSLILFRQLEAAGHRVLEVYPYATKRLLFGPMCAAKETAAGRAALLRALQGVGLQLPCSELSHHELDAIVAAYTVYLFAHGRAEQVGDDREGYIVVPRVPRGKL